MTNVTFKYVRLGEVNVFLSYKGSKWANLEDFDALHLKLHSYVVSNQTSTGVWRCWWICGVIQKLMFELRHYL